MVDTEAYQITFITAITQDNGVLTLSSNQFINYTQAIVATSASVKSIEKNSFVDCPIGIILNNVNNTVIKQNTMKNAFITGISVTGDNITVQDNYIFSERNLLQGNSSATDLNIPVRALVHYTLGIHLEGGSGVFLNNTVINTFKGFYIVRANHILLENNVLSTSSGEKEGELQLQSVDFGILRNNTLLNQWDPIEIYNSRHIIVEKNYIENAMSGIRLEKVGYLRNVDPENITVRDNVLVNAPVNRGEHVKNVKFINNSFYHSNIEIVNQSENVLLLGNTIYMGHINILDSRNVALLNNSITSDVIGIIILNSENITMRGNTVFCFAIPIPVPEIFFQNILISIAGFSVILIAILFLLIRKLRRRKHQKKK